MPLTEKPAKNVGGNDANADHLNLIEKAAKNTWDMVRGGKYQKAVYEVILDYSRTTRPGTTQIRGEAEKLKEIRQAWIKNRMELIGKLPESDLAQFYVHTLRSFGITPTPVLPTKEQVIQELANKLSSDDLTKTFGVLKGQKHPVAEVIDKHIAFFSVCRWLPPQEKAEDACAHTQSTYYSDSNPKRVARTTASVRLCAPSLPNNACT